MTSLRNMRTGLSGPVRFFSRSGIAVAAIAAAAVPLPVSGFDASAQAPQAAFAPAGQAISDFYAARGGRPLWLGQPGRQVDVLLELLETAHLDGLNPRKYRAANLHKAISAARSGNPRAVRKADMMLSEALVSYVRDLRRPANIGIIYVDPELRPGPPAPRAILEAAATAPSLERWVAKMGWVHPLYAQLRVALMMGRYAGAAERERIILNLERVRELPMARGRHVLVNAAAQRLFMYEDGQVVDSMRVVVGQPKYATPMMSAFIRYANLNPYWNVPPDLAAERIAPNVVKQGVKYLRSRGYQLLSDWSDDAQVIDPSSVDWTAVAQGREKVRVRQLPGAGNAMGKMKFMFPNAEGIYLHDTPEKELLTEASRLFSGGCVRLEDAARLGEWLFAKPLDPKGAKAEQPVPLPTPVPVYITYLTAVPSGAQLAFFDDIYGRDEQRLAQLRSGRQLAGSW